MQVIVAKSAGFCYGVKRAIEMTEQELKEHKKAYGLGHIVHNKFVNESLKNQGLITIESIKDVPKKQRIIIRAHGISSDEMQQCEKKELMVTNSTCPNVKKIHEIVYEYAEKEYKILIIGDAEHPEVKGIVGWAGENVTVISSLEQINNYEKVCVVSQTTMNIEKNNEIVDLIKQKSKECIYFDTICKATEERQNETRDIARSVDFMVVIGDKSSANSTRLYEISKEICKNTQFIENIDELDLNFTGKSCKIGVTAGASTPKSIIDEVVERIDLK